MVEKELGGAVHLEVQEMKCLSQCTPFPSSRPSPTFFIPPYLSAMLTLEKFTIGVGDRFAHQASAQLRAFQQAARDGVEVVAGLEQIEPRAHLRRFRTAERP